MTIEQPIKHRRITNALRGRIQRIALDKRFAEDRKQLSQLQIQAGDALYQELFPPASQATLQRLKSLDVVGTNDNFTLAARTTICRLNLIEQLRYQSSYSIKMQMSEPQLVPKQMVCLTNLVISREVEVLLCTVLLADAELKKTMEQFTRHLLQLIDDTKSTKKLIELLPQAEDWVKTAIQECSDMQEADTAAKISQTLGARTDFIKKSAEAAGMNLGALQAPAMEPEGLED